MDLGIKMDGFFGTSSVLEEGIASVLLTGAETAVVMAYKKL